MHTNLVFFYYAMNFWFTKGSDCLSAFESILFYVNIVILSLFWLVFAWYDFSYSFKVNLSLPLYFRYAFVAG